MRPFRSRKSVLPAALLLLLLLSMFPNSTDAAVLRRAAPRRTRGGRSAWTPSADRHLKKNTDPPTLSPTTEPTSVPSAAPSFLPTTQTPSVSPTDAPGSTAPSTSPTATASRQPTLSPLPTPDDREPPTFAPTFVPSVVPSDPPTNDSTTDVADNDSDDANDNGNDNSPSPLVVMELNVFRIEFDGTVDDWNNVRQELETYLEQTMSFDDIVTVDLDDTTQDTIARLRRLQNKVTREYTGVATYPSTFQTTRGQVLQVQEAALQDQAAVQDAVRNSEPGVTVASIAVGDIGINDKEQPDTPNTARQQNIDSDNSNSIGLVVGLIAAVLCAFFLAAMLVRRQYVRSVPPPPPPIAPPSHTVQVIPDVDAEIVLLDQQKSPNTANTDDSPDDIFDNLQLEQSEQNNYADSQDDNGENIAAASRPLYSEPVSSRSSQLPVATKLTDNTAKSNHSETEDSYKLSIINRLRESQQKMKQSSPSKFSSSANGEPKPVIRLDTDTIGGKHTQARTVQTFQAQIDDRTNGFGSRNNEQQAAVLFPLPHATKSHPQPSSSSSSSKAKSRNMFSDKSVADNVSDAGTTGGGNSSKGSVAGKSAGASLTSSRAKNKPMEASLFDENKSWTIKSIFSQDDESMAGFSLATAESKDKPTAVIEGDLPMQSAKNSEKASAPESSITGAFKWLRREFVDDNRPLSTIEGSPSKPPEKVLIQPTMGSNISSRAAQLSLAGMPIEQGQEVSLQESSHSEVSSQVSEAPSSYKEESAGGGGDDISSVNSDIYTTAGESLLSGNALGVFHQYDSEEEDEAFIPMTPHHLKGVRKSTSPPSSSLLHTISDNDHDNVFAGSSYDDGDNDGPSDEMNDKRTRKADQDLSGFRTASPSPRNATYRQRRADRVQPPVTMEI